MKTKHFLFTLLMCCVSIGMSAAEWTDANGTVWKFTTNGSNATLWGSPCISGTIPTNLAIPSTVYVGETAYTVTAIGYQAFRNCSNLTSVTIPEGVTLIDFYAFDSCSSLTSINIPEGVTSIGDYTFSACSGLTSINIPEGVTSIGNYAFYGCSSLTSINIPEGVTSIGNDAFYLCTNIQSLYIKNLKKYLQISWGSTSSPLYTTTYDVDLYVNNTLVTALEIPEGVSNIPIYAFQHCSKLTSVNIPESVTSIGNYAFNGCSSLTSVNIPESVTSIGNYAFQACSSLTSINIRGVMSIGEYAFRNCHDLTSINIQGVTSIGQYAFYNTGCCYMYCESATPCTIGNNAVPLTSTIFVPDDAVEDYRAAWTSYSDIIVGNSSNNLVDVTLEALPSSSALAAEIGKINMDLGDVVKLKVSGTINSYDMMVIRNKMTHLRELDLENASIVANDYEYYQGYHSEENVFGGCFLIDTKIKSVVLPTTATSIGNGAFFGCTNLSSVANLDGITSIGYRAFYGCSSLSSIDLPGSLNTLEGGAFDGCSKLTTIKIPIGVTVIQGSTLSGCTALESILLSPQTTHIYSSNAFANCTHLTEFHLPPYIQQIGNYAFSGCTNLKGIYAYMVDVPEINTNTFNDYQHQTLYVPEFLYNKYYYDTNWSQFTNVLVCDLKPGDYETLYAGTSDVNIGAGQEIPGIDAETSIDGEVGNQGGIIVEDGANQPFDEMEQNCDGEGHGGSLIGEGDTEQTTNMPVNTLKVKIQVKANRWYFFCFPYDVTIARCEYPGQYAWREYDGQKRATQGANGWKSVEGTLTARQGYIFQSATAGTLVVNFDHPTFGGNRPKTLTEYICDNAANASWNFVGNPYSCFYDFDDNDFEAPITVWNGTSYQAYRPGDDDYHLQPYEAFFVQKPSNSNQISFATDRRETYRQSQQKKANQVKMRRAQGIAPERLLINLTISDNDTASIDRTRLVLNEKASRQYELECDAAKFISNDAKAQLYMVENGVQMAINERPEAGDIRLGYMAKERGTLCIEAPRMDLPMKLVDTKKNLTFDLSLGSYEFETEAGTFNQRFVLRLTEEATAIKDLTAKTGVAIGLQDGGLSIGGAEGKSVAIYSTNGVEVAQQSGNGFVALPSGMYIVKVANKIAKVYVK